MTLTEAYNNKDELNFGKALRQLAMAGEATLAEAKILQAAKHVVMARAQHKLFQLEMKQGEKIQHL